ncbi:MAG: branched-chain amino acid transport system permease protein [Actinomycetota bacterium]|jgi:branched-chain amino acid transport system permease protein|nr:branched-chain amino acid transport system permease protein [Actinomycetota bacterium]
MTVRGLDRVRAAAAPVAAGAVARVPPLPAAVVGAALLVVGSLSPWATFGGFPGKMSLAGFPGGARQFTLLLSIAALLVVVRLPGRRRAGLTAAVGATAVALYNVVAIAGDGGGLGGVAYGAWLAVAGGAVLAVAFAALPAAGEAPVPDTWSGIRVQAGARDAIEWLAVAGVAAAVLFVTVWGLAIDESSRFASWVVFLIAASLTGARLGLFSWVEDVVGRHRAVALGAAAVASLAFPFTQDGDAYWIRVFASIGVFAAAALGLNVVVGLAGLLDLGYVAFFGVGAYVGALFSDAALTTLHVHLPFLLVVLLGATIAACFGVLLGAPTLRLRGDYLAIVTLGFGEIFRIAAFNLDGVTRGPNGIAGVPNLAVRSYDFGASHEVFGITLPGFANYYFVELVLLAFAIVAFSRLNASRIGRAWVAIREDEVAAAAMGVDTVRLKLLAFAIGAFMAGAAGTVNAHVTTQVSPDSYTFLESILLVAAVVLGGMGSIPGALLGSAALFVIPEKLRAFQDKRLLLFGAALILMMRFRPEGIVPSRRRQREFHEEEGGADATGAPPGSAMAGAP